MTDQSRDFVPDQDKFKAVQTSSFFRVGRQKSTSHYSDPQQCYVGLTILCRIFSTFAMNVENILQNVVSHMANCYGSKYCYERDYKFFGNIIPQTETFVNL